MRVYESCSCKVIGDIELLTFFFFFPESHFWNFIFSMALH